MQALETRFDHLPVGGIHQDRNSADIRFRCHQIQELSHGLSTLQHSLVHVDVDELGAVLNLLEGHFQSPLKIALQDDLGEAPGTGNIGSFSDIDKEGIRADVQGLQPAETAT